MEFSTEQLVQFRTLLEEVVPTMIRKETDPIKKDTKKMKKDLGEIVDFLNEEDLSLKERMDRVENVLHLPKMVQ